MSMISDDEKIENWVKHVDRYFDDRRSVLLESHPSHHIQGEIYAFLAQNGIHSSNISIDPTLKAASRVVIWEASSYGVEKVEKLLVLVKLQFGGV